MKRRSRTLNSLRTELQKAAFAEYQAKEKARLGGRADLKVDVLFLVCDFRR